MLIITLVNMEKKPSYLNLATEIAKLVEEKEKAYGSSFHKSIKFLEEMFPSGIPKDKIADALFCARILDKLFRISTAKTAFNEDPFRDCIGYALLMLGMASPPPK